MSVVELRVGACARLAFPVYKRELNLGKHNGTGTIRTNGYPYPAPLLIQAPPSHVSHSGHCANTGILATSKKRQTRRASFLKCLKNTLGKKRDMLDASVWAYTFMTCGHTANCIKAIKGVRAPLRAANYFFTAAFFAAGFFTAAFFTAAFFAAGFALAISFLLFCYGLLQHVEQISHAASGGRPYIACPRDKQYLQQADLLLIEENDHPIFKCRDRHRLRALPKTFLNGKTKSLADLKSVRLNHIRNKIPCNHARETSSPLRVIFYRRFFI